MNANTCAVTETLQDAANRLASPALRDGFKLEVLHEYQLADGAPLLWRIRCKHPTTGEKWIRPMHRIGTEYALGAGAKPDAGWPLYRLPEILATPDALVWVVEGEPCADIGAPAFLSRVARVAGVALDLVSREPPSNFMHSLTSTSPRCGELYTLIIRRSKLHTATDTVTWLGAA